VIDSVGTAGDEFARNDCELAVEQMEVDDYRTPRSAVMQVADAPWP